MSNFRKILTLLKIFRKYVENIVESLNIKWLNPFQLCTVQHFKNKDIIKQGTCFSFQFASEEKIMKEIPNIDSSKAIQKFDIPTKSIKGIDNIFLRFGYDNFNNF